MNQAAVSPIATVAPSIAFDGIADTYDEVFTRSNVGQAQRRAVWNAIEHTFRRGDHILELNCGTGEDALHMARRGLSVMACDASERMIAVAQRRKESEAPRLPIRFEVLHSEELAQLRRGLSFDGAFSNFSGLNCVSDLGAVARDLNHLLKPSGRVLIGVSTRVCASEIGYFLLHLNLRKAFRRIRGTTIAHLGNHHIGVHYPTIRQIRRAFSPWFRLHRVRAIGLFVPPSYVERWASAHPRILQKLENLDRSFAGWPMLRGIGDHVLLEFRKESR